MKTLTRALTVVGGVSTAYLDIGEGEPIVALHGIPTSSLLFEALAPHLDGYRLIAPDLLGQGHTETPRHGRLDAAAYRHHLDAFLDQLPLSTFHLLVHDFGGVLGLGWAAAHRSRVKSLVVLSTTVSPGARVAVFYVFNLLFGRAALRRALPWTLVRRRPLSRELLDEWTCPWTRRRLLRGWDHFGTPHLRALRDRLPLVDCPTLLVWGVNDRVFPRPHARTLHRLLPDAALTIIPECGHWATIDAPAEIAAEVRRFCGSNHGPVSRVST